ncbi:MAG: hypothetical protein EP298_02600 [Gammaproteobacteria bacterium]|nr:MAG: hypothetical protein EP298_02600 [Gammaproteobacteria bacterium]UTW43423.1 hypothetical protein KFE69_04835 [bacterium SCSIO 12844]
MGNLNNGRLGPNTEKNINSPFGVYFDGEKYKNYTASDALEMFFNRFYSAELPEGVSVEFSPDVKEFTPRKSPLAKDQAPEELEGRDLHSDDFDDFLNQSTVTIPEHIKLTQHDLNAVESALNDCNWKSPVLNDDKYTFCALWLFKQNKISRQQMTTVLKHQQVKNKQDFYTVLDKENQFTKEAKEILIPIIVETSKRRGIDITDGHIERFRLLMSELPKSEQVFFTATPDPQAISNDKQNPLLGDIMLREGSLYQIDKVVKGGGEEESKEEVQEELIEKLDVHLSLGILDARKISIFGINGACTSRAMLGKVSISDVEKGVSSYHRPMAISIEQSGVAPTTKGIHEYDYTPMPVVTDHDEYHTEVQSVHGSHYNLMLNHIKDILRNDTGRKWALEIWENVDRDGFSPYHANPSYQESLDKFATFLTYKMNLDNDGQLTVAGFSLLMDMINHKDQWDKLYNINYDLFRNKPIKKEIVSKFENFLEIIKGYEEQSDISPLANLSHTDQMKFMYAHYILFTRLGESEFKSVYLSNKGRMKAFVDNLTFGVYKDHFGTKNKLTLRYNTDSQVINIPVDRSGEEEYPLNLENEFAFVDKIKEELGLDQSVSVESDSVESNSGSSSNPQLIFNSQRQSGNKERGCTIL